MDFLIHLEMGPRCVSGIESDNEDQGCSLGATVEARARDAKSHD